MKTKIIYISGNEVFEMADIRAAFEEVRTTLNLDADTVLFGVPVDADDALSTIGASATDITDTKETDSTPAEITVANAAPVASVATDAPTPEVSALVIDAPATDTPAPAPRKKASVRRTRAAAAEKNDKTKGREITASAPETDIETAPAEPVTNTVVPILSVLAAHDSASADTQPDTAAPETEIEVDDAPEIRDEIEMEIAEKIPDAAVVAPVETVVDDDATISEMITDDAPADNSEKTLEELLESMTPLREDTHDEASASSTPVEIPVASSVDGGTTDATLEQLASEFAMNQDKIVATPKNETHGKIGKLKNILPFKKAKRDDTGIMGDLFGWAGIAANDEDFSIPGFFTTAAKK